MNQSDKPGILPYHFIANLAEVIPETPPDSIISRTLYSDENLKVVLFSFAQKQELSEHTASVPALLHILTGEANITLGEDSFSAVPGTWVRMSANLSHSIVAKTPLQMLLVLIQSKA